MTRKKGKTGVANCGKNNDSKQSITKPNAFKILNENDMDDNNQDSEWNVVQKKKKNGTTLQPATDTSRASNAFHLDPHKDDSHKDDSHKDDSHKDDSRLIDSERNMMPREHNTISRNKYHREENDRPHDFKRSSRRNHTSEISPQMKEDRSLINLPPPNRKSSDYCKDYPSDSMTTSERFAFDKDRTVFDRENPQDESMRRRQHRKHDGPHGGHLAPTQPKPNGSTEPRDGPRYFIPNANGFIEYVPTKSKQNSRENDDKLSTTSEKLLISKDTDPPINPGLPASLTLTKDILDEAVNNNLDESESDDGDRDRDRERKTYYYQPPKESTDKYILNTPWMMWIHDNKSSDWTIDSYIPGPKITTVEQMHRVLFDFESLDKQRYQYFIMRNEITPIWEDINNRDGVITSIRITTDEDISSFNYSVIAFKIICMLVLNESFVVNNLDINGLSFSIKSNTPLIKLWVKDNKNNYSFEKKLPSHLLHQIQSLIDSKRRTRGGRNHNRTVSIMSKNIEPDGKK